MILQGAIDGAMVMLATRLADAAGDVLRRHWRTTMGVEKKSDNSPVTVADREAEAAMRKLIEAAFPDHGILGEEHGAVRPDAPFQWVLDPIDGTRAFIAGQPTFTTLIALVKDGFPMLGIIDQPVSHERWVGVAGKPTLKNGKTVAVRNHNEMKKAVISTTSMEYFTPTQKEAYLSLQAQCAKGLLGGDGYSYALLASGKLDIVVDASLKPYDFCALTQVIEGAGGVITDWKGQLLGIQSIGTVVAAANADLHRQALRSLQAAA